MRASEKRVPGGGPEGPHLGGPGRAPGGPLAGVPPLPGGPRGTPFGGTPPALLSKAPSEGKNGIS